MLQSAGKQVLVKLNLKRKSSLFEVSWSLNSLVPISRNNSAPNFYYLELVKKQEFRIEV